MERLTYKSKCGDYGGKKEYDSQHDEIIDLRNALGKYEDLGYSPDDLKALIPLANQCLIDKTVDKTVFSIKHKCVSTKIN